MLRPIFILALATWLPLLSSADAQTAASSSAMPRVIIPTARQTIPSRRTPVAPNGQLYPWRQNITATVFWIGEQPTQNNPVPNCKSSWDQNWMANYGGYDNPEPAARVANHNASDFRPKGFLPKLNPFYIALPYNDILRHGAHKPEAARVIPWFRRHNPEPGKTVLKGRWLQIYHGGRSCYAQWEDCGPFVTDDWNYVFGNSRPKNHNNKDAAIDISPAVRDYLDLQSGEKCHWRFVEDAQVPYGPWKKYGQQSPGVTADGTDFEAKRRYLEYLRKLRDQQYQQKSLNELQR
ncbi:hypothetical protein HNR46_001840 [Haloferula luteola]|uniref:Uncharacterized protein n=1 Tax=Haloferula luteola TaxID=595692 RepID=A0A840V2C3_9BACT|nr:hypothetical protein [Haloferula luteola]MBB5351603.1 hypothetical protein [Haloferula luteola]